MAREVKKKKNGKGTGRHLIDVDWDEVDQMCKDQCIGEEIAAELCVDYDTLNRACKSERGMGFREYKKKQNLCDEAKAARADKVKKRKDDKNRLRREIYKKNPSRRIELSTRARIWQAVKGLDKGKGLFSRLEYSLEDLISHLSLLLTDGMTLDNYGEWHIDHIKPVILFDQSNEAQFKECWSLNNLQPLWASDNLIKGCRYG